MGRADKLNGKTDAGDTILQAFRFLEDVGGQLESLRKALKSGVQSRALLDDAGIVVGKFKEEDETDASKWLFRVVIDTFEVYPIAKRGKKKAAIYAAFQISLAPSKLEADETFFPHLAVLLAGPSMQSKWEQWECEEFQLDDEHLADADNPDGQWMQGESERRWHSNSEGGRSVAFVVPLVELRNEKDVKEKVLAPFAKEVKTLLKDRNR